MRASRSQAPRGVLDIGTHTAHLLVIDGGGAVLADEDRVVDLGPGATRAFSDAPGPWLDALASLVDRARTLGVPARDLRAVATAPLRDAPAPRRARILDTLTERLDLDLTVLTGEQEATLAWRGATWGLDAEPGLPLAVVDLGGGSLEIARGFTGARDPEQVESHPLGAVALTERFADPTTADPGALDAFVRSTLGELAQPVDFAIALGGTATLLAALHHGAQGPDPALHGLRLDALDLFRLKKGLAGPTAPLRPAAQALAPSFLPYLPVGLRTWRHVLAHLGVDALTVSLGGVRHGLLPRP